MAARDMLNPIVLREAFTEYLREDIPAFDIGGAVVGAAPATANFFVKSDMVLAGCPFVDVLLNMLDCKVHWSVEEGVEVHGAEAKVAVGVATGPANRLLQAERTALEILSRSSACATFARKCVVAAKEGNSQWTGSVAATRKTTPGFFRAVEKYGALIGGADTHRYSLSTMVMLKDNHIDVAGSITKAVAAARRLCGFSTKIEVECRTLDDALEAAGAGADVIMLDNFTPERARQAVPVIRGKFSNVIVEMSGGITQATVGQYAIDGVDVVSIGKITHGPPSQDISMKIVKSSLSAKL